MPLVGRKSGTIPPRLREITVSCISCVSWFIRLLSRRTFASEEEAHTLAQKDTKWDKTAEIVVIGYGCAGAVAAITAAENGAEAVILEKQPRETHHTNTSMSGGLFITPDLEGGLEYLRALSRVTGKSGIAWTDRAVTRALAEYSATTQGWIESRGGDIFSNPAPGEHPGLPGGAMLSRHRFRGMGIGLARFLDGLVRSSSISILYGTKATHLLTNLRGRVVGVEGQASQDGPSKKVRIRASRAVVLAPGGFEFDEPMKLNHLKVYPTYFTGSEALTGDGVRMATEVGAELWHMNCLSCHFVLKYPDLPVALAIDFLGRSQLGKAPGKSESAVPVRSGHLIVDRDGKRFTSENVKGHALYYELPVFDTHRLIYPRVPSYLIFDRKRLENGPLPVMTSGTVGPTRSFQWSGDNSTELERGWIVTADSVPSLARKIGIPPDALARTVKTFNRHCEKGRDPDFGRTPKELIPIEDSPYCAVPLWPGGPSTLGGPRRNSKGQILNVDGNVTPGLYGCGELGCTLGMLYPAGGGHLTECFAFGRIVGENAIM